MKKQLVRVVCLCLALVVTMGSVGMAASEQICLMAGLSKSPVKPMADTCCAKKKAEKQSSAKAKLSQKCCVTSKQYHKLQTPAAEKPCALKIPALIPAQREVAFNWSEPLPGDSSLSLDNNKSPPLFGTELLKALHLFRV